MIYFSPHAIQAIGPNTARGIIMPFNTKNKRGTWCDANTDFGLDLWPVKPVFELHLLKGQVALRGEITSIVSQEHGLFATLSIDDYTHDYMTKHRTGFSTGSMGHLVKFDPNGYTRRWVIVECSYGEESQLANYPGTTSAILNVNLDLPETTIERGIWIMPPEIATPEPETVVTPGTPTLPDPILALTETVLSSHQQLNTSLAAITARLETLEHAPTRTLPATPATPVVTPMTPIQVAGPYDHRPLLGMLFEDDLRIARAHEDKNSPYERDNIWWRSLIAKCKAEHTAHPPSTLQCLGFDLKNQPIMTIPDEPIPDSVWQMFHERTPYLDADEAMRTDYTSYGLELVPTLWGTVMYHYLRSESKVFGLFEAFKPTSYPVFNWPVITSGPIFRLVPQLSDESQLSPDQSPIPANPLGTGKVTFTAGSIGARTLITEQMLNASSAPLMDAAIREYVLQTAAEIDWMIVNAQNLNTAANISHGAIPEATAWDKVLAFDGLREKALVESATDSVAHATIAITSNAVAQALMGARGVIGDDIPNLVNIAAPETARKFYALTDYQSIADVGERFSTLLHGMVGVINGIPLVPTPAVELADANGKYEATHAAGTVGSFLLCHRKIVKVALFQPPRLDTDYVKHARTWQLFTTLEMAVEQLQAGGVAYLFNNTI